MKSCLLQLNISAVTVYTESDSNASILLSLTVLYLNSFIGFSSLIALFNGVNKLGKDFISVLPGIMIEFKIFENSALSTII